MKKLLAFAALFAVVALTSCKYDDDDLWNSVHGLENRVAKLEELCKQMNTNISSLQTIVTALQNNVYVTGTTPLMKDGKEIGYTITFSKGNPITIYHGKDGQDGEDGTTPTIGVKKDTDGVYYWTLNGEFIVVDGEKIQAEGKDGTNGTNGTTPQFKIENDYWFVSYDNGANWTQLGKATGEDGIGGDSMFSGVDYETSTDYVIFTLSNGTQIKLPTWSAFEALQRLCNETNTNLSALQTIVTALQNNDYITSVDPLTENGKVVGYTIKFAKSNPIVIYNGKDGADGVDGNTPVIGVKKDTDDIYYWTLDGEFIVVDGQKIKAQGTDGNNGTDGSDGVTPKLEIREGYWWISYDNGTNWTQLGKATGEDGKDADSIKITQDENNVYFELADGTVITISKSTQQLSDTICFEDLYVKIICVNNWDKNNDGELSYDEAEAVTNIGQIFAGNDNIQMFNELKYFTNITSIPIGAFDGCSSLWQITIPRNVTIINQKAFRNCISLISCKFDDQSQLSTISGGYEENHNSENYKESYGAFYGCRQLQGITIPQNVKIIEPSAFKDCVKLEYVLFEENASIQEIGGGYNSDVAYGAFTNCSSLKEIIIPASVKTIGISAFQNCRSLQTVLFEPNSRLSTITGGIYMNAGSWPVGYGAFRDCKSLDNITIPASVETIEQGAFFGCSSLASLSFEENSILKTIGGSYYSFNGKTLYNGAFAYCSALTSVHLPQNITRIQNSAFQNCTKLSSIYVDTNTPPILGTEGTYNGLTPDRHQFTGTASDLKIYVPTESVDTYKSNWSTYSYIITGFEL